MGAICANSKEEDLVHLNSKNNKPIKQIRPVASTDTDWFNADKETLYRENQMKIKQRYEEYVASL